jgi:hypothetical protein
MTAASPVDMQWLHSSDAKRLGIAAGEISDLNLDLSISVEKPNIDSTLKSEATAFVINYFNQWAVSPPDRLISALAIEYSDNVEYFGAMKSVADVLSDKQKLLQSWPIRNYQVRLDSLTTNCVEGMFECMVTGIVDWGFESPEKSTSITGSSRFSFNLGKVAPERFVIMRENAFVLTKRSSSIAK